MKIVIVLLTALGLLALVAAAVFIPILAERVYGPANPEMGWFDRLQYSALLLWYDGLLTRPRDPAAVMVTFEILPGESVQSIAYSLEDSGLIRSAPAFRDYLVYAGLDTAIQSGQFELSAAMSPMQIADRLQDATPGKVTLGVLAGWRLEEIAASLPTSGLGMSPEAFIAAARAPRSDFDFLAEYAGTEGFLFPTKYVVPRNISPEDLVTLMVRNFALYLDSSLREAIAAQGLSIYEAVTLASMVEREAVVEAEMPMIASVFLNRRAVGMKYDSDPTVQYALGWNMAQQTWWTNPLSAADLQVDSPYNTYRNTGLPPSPISSPSLAAIRAVAYPAQTPYYYFRARCDGSGTHVFAETYEEHLNNGCP